jgi:TonB family protein
MSGREFPESAASAEVSLPPDDTAQGDSSGGESDFTRLASRLAEHGQGIFSLQLSADLALEIVLNEIVEQACLTMRATGAAIILEREGELVCRACSGSTAPGLGTRLDTTIGLSGECVQTLHSQRCDDALTDPRADIDACGQLGVRSVMVLPLLMKQKLVGVFEVFSAEPHAFSEREERTAEAFAHRIVKNLERASEPLEVVTVQPEVSVAEVPVSQENLSVPPTVLQSLQAGLESIDPSANEWGEEKVESKNNRGLEILTWVLAAAVLICTLLLGQRFVLRRAAVRAASNVSSAKMTAAANQSANPKSENSTPKDAASSAATSSQHAVEQSAPAAVNAANSASKKDSTAGDSTAAVGSLSVYENGKEVFHMSPSQASTGETQTAPSSEIERASSVESETIEPKNVMQISPEAAEGSLLRRVEPEYPEEARQQEIQGAVVLDVRISPDGAVQVVNVLSGPPLLADAATHAVKQWRFRPHTSHGVAVEMQTRITLNFKLPQ